MTHYPKKTAPPWRRHDQLRPEGPDQVGDAPPHAQQLIQWAAGTTKGCEVGVAWGWTSRLLLEALPELHLTLVDMWAKAGVFPWFQEMIEPWASRTRVLRGDSSSQAQFVENGSLDWVFIDANHYEEGCYKDLVAWYPKVRPGGFFCGHDYAQLKHDGVKKALTRFCSERGLTYTLGTPESDCWRIEVV